jgi:hypothetical protein
MMGGGWVPPAIPLQTFQESVVVSRRSVLGGAAGLAAGAVAGALPGRSASAAPAVDAAGALVNTTTAEAGTTLVTETAFPLTHLSIDWEGPAAGAALRTRTSAGWSAWRDLGGCNGGFGDVLNAPQGNNALASAVNAVGYELKLPDAAVEVKVAELNTTSAKVATPAVPPKPGIAAMIPSPYYTRAMWGADESWRYNADGTESWPPAFFPVQTLTVHHTGDDVEFEGSPDAHIRSIYYNQAKTKAWGDVGYHLFIDRRGRLYEGRWSGTDLIPVFGTELTPNWRPQMVNAAHAVGYNAGNVSVCLLGNYNDEQPSNATRKTLVFALAALSAVCGLDPKGTTNYVNPISGAKRTVNTIAGHFEWAPTDCPGLQFRPFLGDLRRDVAKLLNPFGK